MTGEPNELTVKDYLHEVYPEDEDNDALRLRMCELLNSSLDSGTCEGGAESFNECDIETSVTYRRSSLDWAYKHVHR